MSAATSPGPDGGDAQCDRCILPTPGTRRVVCWYGCEHWQCDRCASATETDALEELYYVT